MGSPLVLEEAFAQPSESTIRISRFIVPTQTQVGEVRRIYCSYELQGATLHALKLFKDEHEFYRFTPRDKKMTFAVPGVHVDANLAKSEREVWLRINKQSAGKYKCQVSIEGTFNSVTQERQLEVLDQLVGPGAAGRQPALRPHKSASQAAAAVRMQTLTIQNGTRASGGPGAAGTLNQHFAIPSMSQFLPASAAGPAWKRRQRALDASLALALLLVARRLVAGSR